MKKKKLRGSGGGERLCRRRQRVHAPSPGHLDGVEAAGRLLARQQDGVPDSQFVSKLERLIGGLTTRAVPD